MNKIPLTHILCGCSMVPDKLFSNLFAELLSNGADSVVLNEWMAQRLLDERNYYSQLEQQARTLGMKLFEIHAPFGECWDLNCSVKARRKEMIREHIRCMNYAAELGCKTYVIHIGAWDCIFRPEIPLETMRSLALDSLEKLLPEAEKAGIILAVENSFELSNSPDEVLYLLKNFDSPFLGCCFDTGHANYMAPSPDGTPKAYSAFQVQKAWRGNLIQEPAALEKLYPHIVTCHLHDNNGLSDGHLLPGRGTIDWKPLMKKLLAAPRLVSCQSEVGFLRDNISIKEFCSTMNALVYGN